ncbi:MAG: T9SS type A sorting domain-containing protein [Crocinitomicaceae bacterium]|nr:T9SS type A sorting domain-containing protein [Crocinitomicaceae bacterium]
MKKNYFSEMGRNVKSAFGLLSVFFLSQNAFAQCPVDDQTVSAAASSFTCSGSTNINVGNSQNGVSYFLINNSSGGAVIGAPVAGNGAAISLPTGTITSTTNFGVYGANPSTALQFNGTTQYATDAAPAGLPTGSVITVEAWVYPTAYPDANYNGVLTYGPRNCSPAGKSFVLSMTNQGRPSMATWCNDFVPTSGPTATLNTWNHIACVVNGTSVKLYLNGYEWSGTITLPSIISGPLNIGCTDNPGRFFNGRIDEVRIWNTARTKDEIDQNKLTCLTGTEPGLVSYYKMEEGVGATLDDIGPANNDMSLINTPAWVSGSPSCTPCFATMVQTATVTINGPADQVVSPSSQIICPNTSATIGITSSENGLMYTMTNSLGSVVDGPYTGNGSAINFSTGILTASETYDINVSSSSTGLDFDGANDYVVLPVFDFSAGNTMTIEAWIKPDNITANPSYEISRQEGGSISWILSFQNNGTILSFGLNTAVGGYSELDVPITATNYTDGNWHHVAAVYNGTNKFLYVDGVLIGTQAKTGNCVNGGGNNHLGRWPLGSEFFDGVMDDVRFWSTAKSQSDIVNGMHTCLTGAEAGLRASYKFDSGISSAYAYDGSPFFSTGTLTNFTTSTCWVNGYSNCTTCASTLTTTATVTVQDLAATVASTPGDFSVNVDASTCGAVVTYTAPTFDDDCDGTGLAGVLISGAGTASGQTFPAGTTTVEFEYVDGGGNSTIESFDVTVIDNEAPVISGCPSDISQDADLSGCSGNAAWIAPTASDVCVGSITPTASHTSGDLFTEGVTTVTYDFDDGNGNISTCSFDVEIVNPVDGISTEMDVTCFGGSDGSIDITVTSGTAPFTFDWTDGGTFTASTEDISGIPAGNYTITATDANDCETGGTITITEPTEVTVSIDATSNPTGCGLADGSASVTANGGTESGAYDFDWTDGGTFSSTTEDQTGLLAGSYIVTATDDNGCTGDATVNLSDPNGPTLAVNGASFLDLDCNGDADGDIQMDVTLNGGATSATYDWDNDGTGDTDDTEDLSSLPAGTYNVEVVDNNNCVSTLGVTVNEPTAIDATDASTDVTCNGDGDGAIDLTISGGTVSGAYTVSWTDGGTFSASTEDISSLDPATYSVTITDDNGCTFTDNYVISEPAALSANGTSTDEMTGNDGTIDLTVTGGTGPYTFDWTDGGTFSATTEDLTGLAEGAYDVTVTDANGCTTTAQVIVGSQVGVNENDQFSFTVYPNPTSGMITIKVNSTDVNAIRISDATGRVVMVVNDASSQTEIDLSAMQRGIYFVEILNGKTVGKTTIVLQ